MVWAPGRERFPARNRPAVLSPKSARVLNSCTETAITLLLFIIDRVDPALEAAVTRVSAWRTGPIEGRCECRRVRVRHETIRSRGLRRDRTWLALRARRGVAGSHVARAPASLLCSRRGETLEAVLGRPPGSLLEQLGIGAEAVWRVARGDRLVRLHSERAIAATPTQESTRAADSVALKRAWQTALDETRLAFIRPMQINGLLRSSKSTSAS